MAFVFDSSTFPKNLPLPNESMQVHMQRVLATVREEIAVAGGAITFAHYMHTVLYAPGLGYYSAGSRKLGADGDFVTAPEISPLFSYCLARNCQRVLESLPGADVLELGAGSGVMAKDVLTYLEQVDSLPQHYLILEVSADLRARQQARLHESLPHLFERIVWLDKLPTHFRGAIIGNEVVDAMPVHLFRAKEQGIFSEIYVECDGDKLAFCERPLRAGALYDHVANLQKVLPPEALLPGYSSEVNLIAEDWLTALANALVEGVILLLDYGFPQHEYYHPDRSMGTLMCHYRHHSHDNPLLLPGLQDITAHVNFSALARSGEAAGLTLQGYTTQAHFLLASGLDEMMAQSDPNQVLAHIKKAQQVKKLVMPNEMGELFKAIAMTKGIDVELPGFTRHNLMHRLC